MDDRTLLRAVLAVAALSLVLNLYTLNEVRQQPAASGSPANRLSCEDMCEVMFDCGNEPPDAFDACFEELNNCLRDCMPQR